MFRFDKLVRDKIAPQMEKDGCIVKWRVLDDEEFAAELAKKLEEELDELEGGVGKNRERDLKELADIAEVYELAFKLLDQDEYYDLLESAMEEIEKGLDMWEIDPAEILETKAAKIDEFGAFKNRTYIETVQISEDDPWIDHYLASPDKYPEVNRDETVLSEPALKEWVDPEEDTAWSHLK